MPVSRCLKPNCKHKFNSFFFRPATPKACGLWREKIFVDWILRARNFLKRLADPDTWRYTFEKIIKVH